MQLYHLAMTGKNIHRFCEQLTTKRKNKKTVLVIMPSDSGGDLQHPRRNLGNRFRSQAEKFVKLSRVDPERMIENLNWAEQNARQAILHDFTDERNWNSLGHIKLLLEDKEGMYSVLTDIFTILGRDPENLLQLEKIDMLEYGGELLTATLSADPLDADAWWQLCSQNEIENELAIFSERCKRLDFRDQRANIIFGRRLERILKSGRVELFIDLVQHLLAHRPGNHELWLVLGRLYENRNEWEQAWLCYDHVQQILPHLDTRDLFRERLENKLDRSWNTPGVDARSEFLKRMQELSSIDKESAEEISVGEHDEINQDEVELKGLLNMNDYASAFFLARRLVANGDDWANEYLELAKGGIEIDSD